MTALRLTEKGYRVGVLEAGARFADERLRRHLVGRQALPVPARGRLLRHPAHRRAQGLPDRVRRRRRRRLAGLREHALRAAAGVLHRPRSGAHITDWKAELAPYYDQAKRMLGVVENPLRTPADEVMEKVATEMGVGDTFHPTPVGVFFGGPGDEQGADRGRPVLRRRRARAATCIGCGECMSGCRHNAKNTLVKNYLYLAEQNGATGPAADHGHPASRRGRGGGYDVHVQVHQGQDSDAARPVGCSPPSRSCSPPPRWAPSGCCTGCATRGTCRGLSRAPRLPLADQLRVDRRRHRARHLGRLQPGRRDHLELPPRRRHPHRAGALRQGQQLHVADADRAHRRRRPGAALAHLAARDVDPARQRPRPLRPQALVGADRDRAGDAEPRQLDHDLHQARSPARSGAT